MTREDHLLRMIDLCSDALAHIATVGRTDSARADFARAELQRAGAELDALHDADRRGVTA